MSLNYQWSISVLREQRLLVNLQCTTMNSKIQLKVLTEDFREQEQHQWVQLTRGYFSKCDASDQWLVC